jgi:hypothetical protein
MRSLEQNLLQEILQFLAAAGVPELGQRLGLYLADAFARYTELPAHLFQGPWMTIKKAEAELDDLALADGEGLEHCLQLFLQKCKRGCINRDNGLLVLYEVA